MSGPIVAMGGAEWAMRPENEALHDYVLGLTGRERPDVCLLPTASGDPHALISSFHGAMDRRAGKVTSISLFRLVDGEVDVREQLLAQDLIYVAGGNMVNLIALWREHGLDEVMREAHARGTVLCGYSAGSMCWFEWGVSRGVGTPVANPGLGLLAGSHCVHYSQDPGRRSAYRELVGSSAIPGGLALDDHAAALFRDGAFVEAVRTRESSRAFRVEAGPDGPVETPVETRAVEPTVSHAVEPALEEMRAIRQMRAGRSGDGRSLPRG
jgi:dipeptidase E